MQRLESTGLHKEKRTRRVFPAGSAGVSGSKIPLLDTIKKHITRRASASDSKPAFTREHAGAMARLFTDAIKIWNLSDDEAKGVLGGMSLETLAQWAKDRVEHIDHGHCRRLVRLILIHQGLRYVFDDPNKSYAWIHRPAPLFDGRTALEFIADADLADLEWFHGWLNGVRVGW